MFYPAPSDSLHDEATWRLFAQLMQAPFYQRLRVELQLGYAVFSGFRQIAGHGGLLFGVQSPSASAEQLVAHIETFIEGLPALINAADLPAQVKILQDQLETADMEHLQAAELLWQAHLAGHGNDYSTSLQHSLAHLRQDALLEAAHRLAQPDGARLCLSNRASAL
jgi:secreted Zn-dependent insulinase-like peptidase